MRIVAAILGLAMGAMLGIVFAVVSFFVSAAIWTVGQTAAYPYALIVGFALATAGVMFAVAGDER